MTTETKPPKYLHVYCIVRHKEPVGRYYNYYVRSDDKVMHHEGFESYLESKGEDPKSVTILSHVVFLNK